MARDPMPLREAELEIVLQGGLDVKEAEEIEDGRVGFRELDGFRSGTQIGRLERTPVNAAGITVARPSDATAVFASQAINALGNRGNEPFALTNTFGVAKVYSVDSGSTQAAQLLTASASNAGIPQPSDLTMTAAPAEVSRSILHSAQAAKNSLGIATAVTAALCQDGQTFVAAWVEYRAAGAVLHLRAYSIVNDTEVTVASVERSVPTSSGGYYLSSTAITQTGLEGAVVSYADVSAFPSYAITFYHYDQALRRWRTVYAGPSAGGPYHTVFAFGANFLLAFTDRKSVV